MEDLFTAIGDIIKPNQNDIAFKELHEAIVALEINADIKIDLLNKLSKYILTL
jgi:hypothetical protein